MYPKLIDFDFFIVIAVTAYIILRTVLGNTAEKIALAVISHTPRGGFECIESLIRFQ